MATPNPFRDVGPWNMLRVGGRLIKAALVEIDGVSTKDEWKEQKSKETSGKVYVFAGTTVEKPKLTLEAFNAEDFDDLGDLWNLLVPVPGQGTAATTAAASTAPTLAIGSPAKGSMSSGGTSSGGSFGAASEDAKDSKKDNPGPRPPTVSVQNQILAWHGITAIARGEWDGPKPTATNSWRVILTVVPQQPPKPAGAGAMTPAPPGAQQFTIGAGGGTGGATPGTGTPQENVNTNASQGATGT